MAEGKFTIYPLFGLNVFGAKTDGFEGKSKLGVNIGGGIEVPVASSVAIKLEYNYKTQGNGGSFLKAGVVIPF